MPLVVRSANPADAAQWVSLIHNQYAAVLAEIENREAFAESQLDASSGWQTWVAEDNGELVSSVACRGLSNPVVPSVALARLLIHPTAHATGAGSAVVAKVTQAASAEGKPLFATALAGDYPQQQALESAGLLCLGFHPLAEHWHSRPGAVYYGWLPESAMRDRVPISALPIEVCTLASRVLTNIAGSSQTLPADTSPGYPLVADFSFHDATFDDYELWRLQAQSPVNELAGGLTGELNLLGIPSAPDRAILGQRGSSIEAGLAYHFDERDGTIRIHGAFAAESAAMGALLQRVLRVAQEQLGGPGVELDVLAGATGLLKCAEQIGFVAIAYLPCLALLEDRRLDVVRIARLRSGTKVTTTDLAPRATEIASLIREAVERQQGGVAAIETLRALAVFAELGDSDLLRIAQAGEARELRPSDRVFAKGDPGLETYVVMQGKVDFYLDELAKPVGSLTAGQIFGETTFLEESPRPMVAYASEATRLLVWNRERFVELMQREPKIGMTIMRNLARELSQKLRRANATIASLKR